jgi:hypothetical protein
MIASRLRERRAQITVSIKAKTLTSGQYVENSLAIGLIATHTQPNAFEVISEAGIVALVTDIFWFAQIDGSLPAITEKHVIVDASGNRYEIMMVQNQGGEGNRLKVMTRSIR